MSDETATAIASGVGPLIVALIAAYQLWLKPKVDEPRELPFDLERLTRQERAIGKIRLQLILFTLLVAGVALIPVGGTIASLRDVDFDAAISLPKVLVSFAATVGTIHVVFMVGRVQAVDRELQVVRTSRSKKQEGEA
jgi:hypothetical protein